MKQPITCRPSPFITTNNFGGGFVSNDDRVALSALALASDENPNMAGLPCPSAAELNQEISNANGSLEEVCSTLPPWAQRAGARETIYLNPSETKVASMSLLLYCFVHKTTVIASHISVLFIVYVVFISSIKNLHLYIAVVTCGGLCPGLNDTIQGLVYKCEDYGIPEGNILGIRYGFEGFYDKHAKPMILTRRTCDQIHLEGGTVLGVSKTGGGADLQ